MKTERRGQIKLIQQSQGTPQSGAGDYGSLAQGRHKESAEHHGHQLQYQSEGTQQHSHQ